MGGGGGGGWTGGLGTGDGDIWGPGTGGGGLVGSWLPSRATLAAAEHDREQHIRARITTLRTKDEDGVEVEVERFMMRSPSCHSFSCVFSLSMHVLFYR